MSEDKPLVTIGMPVYNAERYLRLALSSLLSQDYSNFELLISDNASTDATEEICREYAARDSRIRYFRNETNIGSAKNFSRLLELGSGKYFMWSAHDDLRAPNYTSECVAVLERNPSAVCCFTPVVFIDEDGKVVLPGYEQGHAAFGSPDHNLRERVRYLLSHAGWYSFYALMRTEALKQTSPMQNLLGLDLLVLFELSLMGPLIKIPQPLFFYRIFPNKTTEEIMMAVDANRSAGAPTLAHTDILRALLRALRKARVSTFTKLALYFEIVINFCFRNVLLRNQMAAENMLELKRAYHARAYKRVAAAAPFCLLALPEKVRVLRQCSEQRAADAYHQRKFGTLLRSLFVHFLLTPGKLFRQRTWTSVVKLLKRPHATF
ncbi:MAG: glycosyltransferase [Pyrinomonadaceae bacterium]